MIESLSFIVVASLESVLDPLNSMPFMPNELFFLHSSNRSIFNISVIWLDFIITMFYGNSFFFFFNANSIDPDQTPLSESALFAKVLLMGC